MVVNLKIVFNIQGMLLMIIACFIPAGLPFSLYYGDADWLALLEAAGITFAAGFLLFAMTGFKRGDYRESLRRREGYLIVAIAWIVISALGALPFTLSGAIPSYLDAYFETISGFTTTGASILNNIEAMPHGLLFWRAMTQWLGGMGIIVLSLAILPLLGASGTSLYTAEMAGPSQDKIHPRVQGIAVRLWLIYLGLTGALCVLLFFGGMSVFDSLAHALTTVATGGFSTKNASIAHYASPYIQYVIIVFMFLGGTNFSLHYFLLKGRYSTYAKDDEFRLYFFLLACLILLITGVVYLDSPGAPGFEKSFRDAAFQVVSIVTTTGFITADYEKWSACAPYLFFVMLFLGASAGSTTGGIKMVRILLLFRAGMMELRKLAHPRAVVPIKLNGRRTADERINSILAFFIMYILIFVAGSLGLALLGVDFNSAVGGAATALGCVGPGLGVVGPVSNFSAVPGAAKVLLCFLMLLGRLEIFTLLVILSPAMWKI